MKDFIKNVRCFVRLKFYNLARTKSFLTAFLRNEDTYSLKFRFLSICKPKNFCYFSKLFHLQFEPKHSHAYNQIPAGDFCLDLVLYYYSETIQLLVSYHVLTRSLDLCNKKKMWYHLQSYKPQETQ